MEIPAGCRPAGVRHPQPNHPWGTHFGDHWPLRNQYQPGGCAADRRDDRILRRRVRYGGAAVCGCLDGLPGACRRVKSISDAEVVEQADTRRSGRCALTRARVQIPPSAPLHVFLRPTPFSPDRRTSGRCWSGDTAFRITDHPYQRMAGTTARRLSCRSRAIQTPPTRANNHLTYRVSVPTNCVAAGQRAEWP